MLQLSNRIKDWYQLANKTSGGLLELLRITIRSFTRARAPQAAAAIAFFAFFSMFPLLIVMVSIGSYFLGGENVYDQVFVIVEKWLPVSQQLIHENLQSILAKRGTIGIVGLLGLYWSASAVFTTISHNIGLAWPEGMRRNFLQNRLVAFVIIGSIVALLGLTFAANTVATLIPKIKFTFLNGDKVIETGLWPLFLNIAPPLSIFILLLGLYKWVPNTNVSWKSALISSLLAAIAWYIATSAFTWYLSSGLVRYEVVYGSLGAIVALLLVIYILNWITLFGSHLCSAINRLSSDQLIPKTDLV